MLGLQSLNFKKKKKKEFDTHLSLIPLWVNTIHLDYWIPFLVLWALTIFWKNLVFLSPSFVCNSLDFSLQEVFSKMGHWLYSSMTTLLLLLSSLNLDNQFDLRHVTSKLSHSQTLFIPNFKIVLQSFQFTEKNKAKRYHEINSLPLVFNEVLEPLHFKPYNLESKMVFTPSYSFIQQHNKVINDYS